MRYSLDGYHEHQQMMAFNLFYLLFVMCFILASEGVQEMVREGVHVMVKRQVGANAELTSLVFLDFLMTIAMSFALKLEKAEVSLILESKRFLMNRLANYLAASSSLPKHKQLPGQFN